MINDKNGRPLPTQTVTVSFLYDGGEKAPAEVNGPLTLQTDDHGEAHFDFPQPPPAHLAVTIRIDWSRWRCPCSLLDSTQNVVKFGVVMAERSGKAPINRKPGEVLFVVRPLSLFYRLLGPLEKE